MAENAATAPAMPQARLSHAVRGDPVDRRRVGVVGGGADADAEAGAAQEPGERGEQRRGEQQHRGQRRADDGGSDVERREAGRLRERGAAEAGAVDDQGQHEDELGQAERGDHADDPGQAVEAAHDRRLGERAEAAAAAIAMGSAAQ
nr:hypothetical protein GCM10020092_035770 [Actinoplanes digitatis]